jgi:threonyl-tRNA synthetase
MFGETGQKYKVEIIQGLPDDAVISLYDHGGFTDLCAGPHVQRTGNCKHFKLLKVSGAYWRGDSSREQLQRIYGTVWKTRDQLDAYMYKIEEAKKRDHRKLGTKLGLFMFHEYAPGAPFWLKKGEDLYHTLSEAMRSLLITEGYDVVRTPMLFDKALWETSGHWAHYQDAMFSFQDGEEPKADEGSSPQRVMGLKPMNCPCHMLMFGATRRSYRELPMRIHDQGVLHRDELRGALSGLTRVRQFCQDDAHIFCTEEQIESEVASLLDLVKRIYTAFDLGFKVKLSTRPEKKLGDDALWDQAEGALIQAMKGAGVEYELNEGDGAFYGPKIDFDVLDALGRDFQCATIQLDFQLPRRFDLSYIGADNDAHIPVVIHRAIFGSFERFIGILIEHYAGAFPVWLAPEQVRVITVSEKSNLHGGRVYDALKKAGIKVSADMGDEKIGRKIRDCHGQRLPYMAIVGEREQEENTVSIRSRDHGDLGSVPLDEFVARVVEESKLPMAKEQ